MFTRRKKHKNITDVHDTRTTKLFVVRHLPSEVFGTISPILEGLKCAGSIMWTPAAGMTRFCACGSSIFLQETPSRRETRRDATDATGPGVGRRDRHEDRDACRTRARECVDHDDKINPRQMAYCKHSSVPSPLQPSGSIDQLLHRYVHGTSENYIPGGNTVLLPPCTIPVPCRKTP